MRIHVATVVAVAAGLLAASSAFGQVATLRYRWVTGDEVRYRFIQQTTTTVSGLPGAGDMTVEQSSTQVIRLTVEDVAADGSGTVRQTFESVRMELKSPAGTRVFDSATGEPSDPMGKALAAMTGESIIVIVAPTGEVLKVEGMSRVFEKFEKALPPNPGSAQMLTQLKASLSDDAMRNMFGQSFGRFPDQAVQPGDTWSSQFSGSSAVLGTFSNTTTSTFKGVEMVEATAVARIVATVVVKQEAPTSSGPVGLAANFAEGTGLAESQFDVAKGRLRRSILETEMPATLSMPSLDGGQIKVQSLARSKMTMEIVEK